MDFSRKKTNFQIFFEWTFEEENNGHEFSIIEFFFEEENNGHEFSIIKSFLKKKMMVEFSI